MRGSSWSSFWLRVTDRTRYLLVLAVVGLVVVSVATFAAVEFTAQPSFCNSCHMMGPYYDSWKEGSHSDVGCIECHYEPGVIETLEGKFKALSQVAKYVTRTEGTKPWAEVSDHSCMRSGCHSSRMLEGDIDFDGIRFDHRHHLLESRRGRQLRCTSCHSQVEQESHMSVRPQVCHMCHFKPVEDGEGNAATSDCLLCHGPPQGAIDIDGEPFVHADYVERGVACRECHDPAVRGDGSVNKDRCRQCHGEAGHIGRFDETVFLHQTHVTEHKVECFECHSEIEHGLLPLEHPESADAAGCGTCHEGTHDSGRDLFAGRGGIGVLDEPSRMYATRVVCAACHTGRSGRQVLGQNGGHGSVASAGGIDCIHCHGTGFDGMLERWQQEVEDQLERLEPQVARLEGSVPVGDEAAPLVRDARSNIETVQRDGSLGAHNISYTLSILQSAAQMVDRARALTEPNAVRPLASSGFPLSSEHGCTSACHLGIERVPDEENAFPHQKHLLGVALDCSVCHATAHFGDPGHGQMALESGTCSSCHHIGGSEARACTSCHATQSAMLQGTIEPFAETPAAMASLSCEMCHDEAPAIVRPDGESCASCHGDGYAMMLAEWQTATDLALKAAREALDAAKRSGADAATLAAIRRRIQLVEEDGSRGAHNPEMAAILLDLP